MNRDIDKERHIGILSVTTVRYGQANDANSDTINEWEIETLPSARYTDILHRKPENIMEQNKETIKWEQRRCDDYREVWLHSSMLSKPSGQKGGQS